MKLCMFHPLGRAMERGWVGRIEDEHVVHLAAQTLQAFFTGGGKAREHAVYPLDAVRLLAPVLHPPAVRIFDDKESFAFANPAAIMGPHAVIPAGGQPLALLPRIAAVIGPDQQIAGFTGFVEWRRSSAPPPKDRDFALGLGPTVVTPDELPRQHEIVVRVDGDERRAWRAASDFEWETLRSFAAGGTTLRPGDLLAAPSPSSAEPLPASADVAIEFESIGTLRQVVR